MSDAAAPANAPVQPVEEPWLIVSDVDSTFITQEVIELIAAHAGVEAEVAEVTERAMRGELDFGESLAHRVALLEGLPVQVLDEVREQVVLSPGAAELVRAVQARGWHFALVSGGFTEVVGPMAASLGIGLVRANRLEIADGRLTGRTTGAIVDREAKEHWLRHFATTLSIPLSRTVAIGDGANDLAMMGAAAVSVAYNAKPIVQETADLVLDNQSLIEVLSFIDAQQVK